MIKKKSIINNIFVFFMILLFTFSNINVVNAAVKNEHEISPQYVTIGDNISSIKISGITAKCTATLTSNTSTKLAIKMELQKNKSGTYSTVETWTASKTGTTLGLTKSRNINILYDYRLKVTFTAGSETIVNYKYA